jgi:site-specific recombinase XerD
MSFETFRADFASRLVSEVQDPDLIQTVLHCLDETSIGYEVRRACTDLIVSDGLPEDVKLYLASKSIENLKKGTLDNYLGRLRRFFAAVRKEPSQVTASDVRLYLAWYKKTYAVQDITMESIRIDLNSFFEWCVDEDRIRKNPMRQMKPIRCDSPERLPMTALELETVRSACKDLREKAIVDVLFSTAARVSEFCAMDISDVDFVEHTVHIRCGKGGKGRTTFLNAEAEVSLKAYLAARKDDNPALFVSDRAPHGRTSKRSIENAVNRIVSRCKLSVKVTPHIFRHTAASLALQRGMPINQVQQWLGHAKIQTTLRYARTLNFDVKIAHQKFVA